MARVHLGVGNCLQLGGAEFFGLAHHAVAPFQALYSSTATTTRRSRPLRVSSGAA